MALGHGTATGSRAESRKSLIKFEKFESWPQAVCHDPSSSSEGSWDLSPFSEGESGLRLLPVGALAKLLFPRRCASVGVPCLAQGVSLTAARERGQLVFLEGLKSCLDLLFGEESESGQPSPLQFISESASNLKALFDFVRTSLTPTDGDSWKGPVLLVDDLSVLLSLGAAPVAVLDFIHYCRVTVCSQLKGNVVVLVHSNEDSEDEENELVVNSLCHHSDLILWVEGLATGFCKDVHGEIKIIKRVSLELTAEQDHVQIYQYKIQDKNVTFFARGLSAAVL